MLYKLHSLVRPRQDWLSPDGATLVVGTPGMIVQVFQGAYQVEFEGYHEIPETVPEALLERMVDPAP